MGSILLYTIRKFPTVTNTATFNMKAAGHNPRALILYHATVRRQWHATMKGRGQPFNISIINEKLLSDLGNQIRDRDQEEIQRQLFMISRRDAPEPQSGYRVGGRSRRRDRDSGRHRSSRSRSPKDRPPLQSFRRHSPTPEATPLSATPRN